MPVEPDCRLGLFKMAALVVPGWRTKSATKRRLWRHPAFNRRDVYLEEVLRRCSFARGRMVYVLGRIEVEDLAALA